MKEHLVKEFIELISFEDKSKTFNSERGASSNLSNEVNLQFFISSTIKVLKHSLFKKSNEFISKLFNDKSSNFVKPIFVNFSKTSLVFNFLFKLSISIFSEFFSIFFKSSSTSIFISSWSLNSNSLGSISIFSISSFISFSPLLSSLFSFSSPSSSSFSSFISFLISISFSSLISFLLSILFSSF